MRAEGDLRSVLASARRMGDSGQLHYLVRRRSASVVAWCLDLVVCGGEQSRWELGMSTAVTYARGARKLHTALSFEGCPRSKMRGTR